MPNKTTVDRLVAQVRRETAERFSPTRYPYTYAADFVRQNPDLVPAEIRPESPNLLSRADASRIRQAWASLEERDDEELARVLADAFMQVHGIVKP